MQQTLTAEETFAQDVREGLAASPKSLPSKYLYDENGDKLFQQIMAMKEYYPTDSEFEVLSMKKAELLDRFSDGGSRPFRLVEFGAGDGLKTKVLLRHFLEAGADFTYQPIDISAHAVESLSAELKKEMPALDVQGVVGDYFDALAALKDAPERKALLFLGSSFGNFEDVNGVRFLSKMRELLNPDDLFLGGFDLKKDPETIRLAYDDPAGVSRAFAMNMLVRINAELGGGFDLQQFKHAVSYDPQTGAVRSYLVSRKPQSVRIEALETTVEFGAWEAVWIELSQKYDIAHLKRLAERTGFTVKEDFYDCKHFYVNSLWQPA